MTILGDTDVFKNLTQSPFMAGITASTIAILYFLLMTISPNLPPALLFSLAIGYLTYTLTKSTIKEGFVGFFP